MGEEYYCYVMVRVWCDVGDVVGCVLYHVWDVECVIELNMGCGCVLFVVFTSNSGHILGKERCFTLMAEWFESRFG